MSKFCFDDNYLLTINFDDVYPKDYSFCFSWYKITSKDKGILVYNKRQWKILHLKEVSSWMQVCYLQKNPIGKIKLNVSMIENVLAIFQWFNEENWESYHYLPFFSRNVESLEKYLNDLFWIQLRISKESQWSFVRWIKNRYVFPKNFEDIISFIFVLICIYWKFDDKNWDVFSIRSHIPLVWWTHLDEELDESFKNLAVHHWIFIASQKVQNWNKNMYQFSSNDKELLSLYVDWVNYYNWKNTMKLDSFFRKQQEIKEQLLNFINEEKALNLNWRDSVLSLLDQYDVKFIKYI